MTRFATRRNRARVSFEALEDRIALSVSGISGYEQLMIELINRSRANPSAEASRQGIALNQDLNPGTITVDAKAPLAAEQILSDTAGQYSGWMLAADFFDHVDPNGDLPWDRTEANGYPSWAGVGENIAWGTFFGNRTASVHARHRSLFLSAGHRENMLDPDWNEIGVGITYGTSPYQSVSVSDFDLSVVTENFGGRSNLVYVTGVAFDDADGDSFYGVGEGIGGVTVTASGPSGTYSTTTAGAGGYSLLVDPGTYTITASGNGVSSQINDVTIGTENVKFDFQPSSTPPTPDPDTPDLSNVIGETGFVTVRSTGRESWKRVQLQGQYSNPVVIVGPPTKNDAAPAVVRVRNVTPTSFQVRIDEWDYLDDVHRNERLGYMVIEAGEHFLPNGQRIVAGKATTNHSFTRVPLDGFNTSPNIITSVNSYVDRSTITTRVRNVTTSGFEVTVQEQERGDNRHARETVGYIAFESGTGGSLGTDYVAGNSGRQVDHRIKPIPFGFSFDERPVFLADDSSAFGLDTAAVRLGGWSRSRATVFVQEERSANREIRHPREIISYLAIEPGLLTAGSENQTNAPPTIASHSFEIPSTADTGFVVGTVTAADSDGDPLSYSIAAGNTNSTFAIDSSGQISIADPTSLVASTSFSLTVEVSDGEATASNSVTIDVLSASTSEIGEAGTVTAQQASADQWYTVNLQRFYSDPIVIMGPLTSNGSDPAVVRIRNVTNTSFQWQIDEWDYLDGQHGTESVSYVVFEAGTHTLSDGTRIVAGETIADHRFTPVILPNLSGVPVVLTSVNSVVGDSAVTSRIRNVSASGFEVRLHEQQKNNQGHALESIHYVAIDPGVGSIGDSTYAAGTGEASHLAENISYGTTFTETPAVLAGIQSYVGGDTTAVRLVDANSSRLRVFLQEEQSKDVETNHAPEQIGFFAIAPGTISISTTNSQSNGIRRAEFSARRHHLISPQSDQKQASDGTNADAAFALLAIDQPNRNFNREWRRDQSEQTTSGEKQRPIANDVVLAANADLAQESEWETLF